MTPVTIMLISRDQPLVERLRRLTQAIGELGLCVLADMADAGALTGKAGCPLIIVHLPENSDPDDVARTLREVMRKKQVAVVAVSDSYRPELALSLLRLGATDCLSRPLDINRLTYLLDVLTLKARYGRSAAREVVEATAATTGRHVPSGHSTSVPLFTLR